MLHFLQHFWSVWGCRPQNVVFCTTFQGKLGLLPPKCCTFCNILARTPVDQGKMLYILQHFIIAEGLGRGFRTIPLFVYVFGSARSR